MKVLNYIEQERNFYDTQTIEVPGNDDYSQSKLIYSINRARLSRYVDDNAHDDIIGDYPYDNISKYRIRLEARATDFDTKHIEIAPETADEESRVATMIATKALWKKMRAINFGTTLNKINDTLPEYGGVLVKKTDEGVHVVPWENVITDMTDIMGGVIIERHYYKPSQLKKMPWKNIDDVISTAAEKKREHDLDQDGKDNTTITDLIEVWEVHGEIQTNAYKEAEAEFEDTEYDEQDDDATSFTMCQIIVAPQGKNDEGDMQGIFLQVNEEDESPYMYMARNPFAGRGMGEGIPEELSEHQRWHNFYKTEEARAVAIGGKVMFVTNDGNVVDTIYDEGINHGTIMKIGDEPGKFFQQLNALPTSIPIYQNIRAEWGESGDKATNSFDAVIGEESKSGTPFRAQYLQNVTGTSQFERYREDIGQQLVTPIIEKWLLPEALEEAAEDDEIYETFTPAELQLIDEVIRTKATVEAEARVLLEEKRPVTPEEIEALGLQVQRKLDRSGSKRSIKGIKEFIEKAAGKVVIHTTDEQRSKAVLFESYTNALKLFAENDPARLAIRDRILDQMGVTKEELSLYAAEAAAMGQMLGNPQANPQLEAPQEEEPLAALAA